MELTFLTALGSERGLAPNAVPYCEAVKARGAVVNQGPVSGVPPEITPVGQGPSWLISSGGFLLNLDFEGMALMDTQGSDDTRAPAGMISPT